MNKNLLLNIANSIDNSKFKLILFPTEQCNFRCVYCYEDFKLQRMSQETIDSVKLFLDKKIPALKLFEIEWFGGEPLLEKGIILEITEYAKSLCANYGVKFYGLITTNGYLLDINTFKELYSANIRGYQISFDGDKEIHNQFRRFANPKIGTFDKIWNNIIDIKENYELDFLMTIRCHLTSVNKESVKSLLNKIETKLFSDKRFRIHLKAISALGSENDDNISRIDKHTMQLFIDELTKKYNELFFLKDDEDYVCYASKPNCFLIRSDSTIGKCTVALNSDYNNVGRLQSDGTVKIDSTKFLSWCSGIDTLNKKQLSCPYYFLRTNNSNNL